MDIKRGRHRIEVDYDLVISLRQSEGLGWKRAAMEYNSRTGQKISKDTYRRRYFYIEKHMDLYLSLKTIIKEIFARPGISFEDEKLL
jgi:hypothetical protein